jgi:hypothetical protein
MYYWSFRRKRISKMAFLRGNNTSAYLSKMAFLAVIFQKQ